MPGSREDFQAWTAACGQRVEQALERALPAGGRLPATLHRAMRYAVLGGGKRVRPLLVYAAGEACTGAAASAGAALDAAACAVELVHAYSLVHDDMPCMDDDVLRRGRPTVHVEFGQATALLAGDALQTLAFEVLAGMPIAPGLTVQAVQALAAASGSQGMAGGQAIDLDSVGKSLDREALETMHRLKTGALLRASTTLGGIVVGASSAHRTALDGYAQAMGLAFQVVDDILDVTADSARLGKTAGKDAAADKPTYVSILGLDAARGLAERLRLAAHEAIAPLGMGAARLAALADFIVLRDR
ncbi:Farnesyl diphosphate synthase [Pigmentiphaga humi]|uniref:Farnesyl diphosphate synthase n=1 Tax=Pigmentiphaga humi TaxID=2478468 RepID=A0A3P4B5Z2_9BURK|nr:farnesyl diphosphate synthase [Pigmentiphaga humi]VCU71331.1 Farnesyl diphosphate synthase [Pigmentiphaga humi]